MTPKQQPKRHGVGEAAYVPQAGGEHWPCIWCVCGKPFAGVSWTAAGAKLDQHMAAVEGGAP
jgi:hypothetical protein